MTRRLAVIGGTGFIGQEVVVQAVAAGWEVVSIDLADSRTLLPHVAEQTHDFRRASITDGHALAAVLDELRPTAAINLVAYGAGTDGLASGAAGHPDRAVSVNIGGLVTLLQTLHAAGCRNLVQASSSTVYGPAAASTDRGVGERNLLEPTTLYGATKLGAEHVGRLLADTLDIRYVALRLPLVYGAGRWYGGSQDALVRFVRSIVRGEPARLEAWTRAADWMHGPDAAGCLLALAEAEDVTGPAYNVTGHRSSLLELGQAIAEAAGASDRAEIRATTEGAPDLPLMDTTAIEDALPFRPAADSASFGAQLYVEAARAIENAATDTAGSTPTQRST